METPFRELRLKRDKALQLRYQRLCEEYPLETDDVIYMILENEFYVEHRTIYAIISGEYERNLERKLNGCAVDQNQLSILDEIQNANEDQR